MILKLNTINISYKKHMLRLTNFLRAIIFNFYWFIWTFFIAIVGLPLLFFKPLIVANINRWWSIGSLFGLKIIYNLDYEVRGLEYIPQDQCCVIASKHQSAYETIIFLSILKDPVYVLKKELIKIPLYGLYLLRSGMIVIDRASRAKAMRQLILEAKNILKQQRPIIVFPEGTRTNIGQTSNYHAGITMLYEQNNIIIPAALNTGLYWPKNSFTKKPGRCIIEFLPAIPSGLPRETFISQLKEQIEDKSLKLLNI